MILLELFAGFLCIGLFSFGGAYGAIPLIRDAVLFFGWLDEETLSYMIAVSESTPGPIMVNMATYIGSTKAGVFGAVISTLAVVLPAFIIIIILTSLLKKLVDNKIFKSVLESLKACVTGIVLAMGAYIVLSNCMGSITDVKPDYAAMIVTAILFLIYYGSRKIIKNGISPVILICISAVIGVFVYGW